MNELGNRLKDLLASHNMSQRELARKVGISNTTISRIVKGQGDVMLSVLIAIADYFDVTIDWLVGRE